MTEARTVAGHVTRQHDAIAVYEHHGPGSAQVRLAVELGEVRDANADEYHAPERSIQVVDSLRHRNDPCTADRSGNRPADAQLAAYAVPMGRKR